MYNVQGNHMDLTQKYLCFVATSSDTDFINIGALLISPLYIFYLYTFFFKVRSTKPFIANQNLTVWHTSMCMTVLFCKTKHRPGWHSVESVRFRDSPVRNTGRAMCGRALDLKIWKFCLTTKSKTHTLSQGCAGYGALSRPGSILETPETQRVQCTNLAHHASSMLQMPGLTLNAGFVDFPLSSQLALITHDN